MDHTKILKSVTDFYNTFDKRQLNFDFYEEQILGLKGMSETITTVKFPIYYLFDHTINKDIGSDVSKRTELRDRLKLDTLFSITRKNIIDISFDNHSTILYKFIFKDRKYLYYSNSGLGINNQLRNNIDNTTACKIFYINEETLWNQIPNYINSIIEAVKDITFYDTIPSFTGKIKTEEIWKELSTGINNKITKSEYDIIIQFIIQNRENKAQNLCYALLNFFWKKYQPQIFECTFNHVLNGIDADKYLSEVYKIIDSKYTLEELINNCYNDTNINIYKKIIAISENPKTDFNTFIDQINIELEKLKSIPTIKYKLENSFKLVYNNISGLYNNEQKSGSCSFYSYYNLGINMKILNVFNTTQNVDDFIVAFIEFHYKMIYLFCVTNDTKFTPISNDKFNESNFHNLKYINRLIKDNNLLDEIIKFYPSTTFIFNPDKLQIDKLLDYFMAGPLIKRNKLINIPNDINIFDDLYTYINHILYNIRNNQTIDIKTMSDRIRDIFSIIIININDPSKDNIYKYLYKTIYHPYDEYHNFNYIYFNTYAEIYIIYLIFLYEIYQEYIVEQKIEGMARFNILYFTIPKLYKHELYWNNYDSRDYKSKWNKVDYDSNFFNIYLNNQLNFNEITNISNKVKKTISFNFFNSSKDKYKIEFKFCNFISINNDYFDLNRYSKDTINLHIIKYQEVFFYQIQELVNLYIKISITINNRNINTDIKDVYKTNIITIKNNIKYWIKNYINNKIKLNVDYPAKKLYQILILILSDNKLFLYEDNKYYSGDFNENRVYDLLINSNTKIYIGPYEIYIKEIFDYLCNLDTIKDENITYLINLISNPLPKIQWIKELDFEILDIANSEYKYKSETYLSLTYFNDTQHNNNIKILLSRFGFDFKDIEEYIFLLPKNNLNEELDIFTLKDDDYSKIKCFILINKYKKCIEITINHDHKIEIDECYIFDNKDKETKNKLLFNLKKETHPFISIIPDNSPYLCYKKDNAYYLEFILSTAQSKNLSRGSAITYKESEYDNFEFSMFKMKIAPSLIFFTLSTYNNEFYKQLFDFYDTSNINIISKIDDLKKSYNIGYDFTDLNIYINELYTKLCSTIGCLTKYDQTKYKQVLELIPEQNKENIFDMIAN